MSFIIIDSKNKKVVKSEGYNYVFDKKTGRFARWGKDMKDDPQFAPFPEILDIEITKSCNGIPDEHGVESPCKFCYKANVPNRESMSIDTFKQIMDKFDIEVDGKRVSPLNQIALGSDATGLVNPDLFKMMEYTRSKGVVPNITLANISDEVADKLVKLCGAVAVSRYENKNICYDSVKKLTDRGMNQVNIHQLVSEETIDAAMQTILDRVSDPRLAKLNAIVFLSVKRKGRGAGYNPVSFDKYKALVNLALEKGIGFGMDSCSAHKFLKAIKDMPNYKEMETMVEPCEAACFSSYVNTFGEYFGCSFGEKKGQGVDLLAADNFSDVWTSQYTKEFREKLLANGRNCILFDTI